MFCGYNWREWQELLYEDRTDGVAHFRLSHLIKLAQSEIEAREIDRLSRSSSARGASA